MPSRTSIFAQIVKPGRRGWAPLSTLPDAGVLRGVQPFEHRGRVRWHRLPARLDGRKPMLRCTRPLRSFGIRLLRRLGNSHAPSTRTLRASLCPLTSQAGLYFLVGPKNPTVSPRRFAVRSHHPEWPGRSTGRVGNWAPKGQPRTAPTSHSAPRPRASSPTAETGGSRRTACRRRCSSSPTFPMAPAAKAPATVRAAFAWMACAVSRLVEEAPRPIARRAR